MYRQEMHLPEKAPTTPSAAWKWEPTTSHQSCWPSSRPRTCTWGRVFRQATGSSRGARPISLGDRQVFQNFSPSSCRYVDSSPIVVCQTIGRIADGQATDSHGFRNDDDPDILTASGGLHHDVGHAYNGYVGPRRRAFASERSETIRRVFRGCAEPGGDKRTCRRENRPRGRAVRCFVLAHGAPVRLRSGPVQFTV